jgi:hypothetical protein
MRLTLPIMVVSAASSPLSMAASHCCVILSVMSDFMVTSVDIVTSLDEDREMPTVSTSTAARAVAAREDDEEDSC